MTLPLLCESDLEPPFFYSIALLFSATFQKRVERLAREVMSDPVRISIGNVGQVIYCWDTFAVNSI